MSNAITVGLVEDDPDQAALYATWIGEAGYAVRRFGTANEFRRRLGAESVDVLVLDWMLPDTPGVELLDWLRHSAQRQLPVIFLTARASESDIVQGLRAGADDYLVKPPRKTELLARIEVLLRRTGVVGTETVVRGVEPYLIDIPRRRASIDGREVPLTDREFELAAFLFRRHDRIVSRDTLLRQVWNLGEAVATRTVDTHVSRLRKKLELDGQHGWRLSAVYQHGYRLERV
jgi:DNA-binding response OmpR family regulator